MPRQAAQPRRRPMVTSSSTRRPAVAIQRVSGSGGYKVRPPSDKKKPYTYFNPGPVGQIGRIVGRAAGTMLGGPVGGALGESVGGMTHYIGKVFGSGDYVTNADRVKRNVLVNDAQIPQFGSGPNTVHIRHREFLGDVISSSSAGLFQVQSFSIQPGASSTFPWLANVVGSNFQQYRVNGMLFEFRSMSADALNSTNTALGSVIMATDYDSADSAFTTKQQMENTEFGISCKPSCSMIHAIECARNQTAISELYVRPNGVPSNADIRLYDLGKFYIASVGMQGTQVNLGELWVTYDITFFKAIQLPPAIQLPTAHYVLDPAQVATKPVFPLATAQAAGLNYDNIGMTFNGAFDTFNLPFNIPVGSCWLYMLTYAGTAANATVINSTPNNGIVALNTLASSSGTALATSIIANPSPSPGTAVTKVTHIAFIKYNGGATPALLPGITLAASVVPLASYTNCDFFITQVNGILPHP